MNEVGIKLGTGVILRLDGVKNSVEHVRITLQVLNEFASSDTGLTVLTSQSDSPLYDEIQNGSFELPNYH